MVELKPCPFCGGKAEIFEDEESYGVHCTNYWCIGHDFEASYADEHYASAAWNRRIEDTKEERQD